MFMPNIKRGSPEQVFIVVRNADSVSMPVGYAVMWNMTPGGTNDGYSVTLGSLATATLLYNPGLFAGLVARKAIQVNDYGEVQVYGLHDNARICGSGGVTESSNLFYGLATQWAVASLQERKLVPYCAYETEAATNYGALAVLKYVNTTTTGLNATFGKRLWAAGQPHCVPCDYAYSAAGATGALTTRATGTTKVFIRCMS